MEVGDEYFSFYFLPFFPPSKVGLPARNLWIEDEDEDEDDES